MVSFAEACAHHHTVPWRQPLAPAWNYSTQFLSPEEQQALVFEQVAAVDLLVLAGANLFVGRREALGFGRGFGIAFLGVYWQKKLVVYLQHPFDHKR